MDSGRLTKVWAAWLKLAGLSAVFSDGTVLDREALRHTFAWRLKDAGVRLAQAMQMMGHTSARMLTEVYGRADLGVSWTMPEPSAEPSAEREEAPRSTRPPG